MSLLCDRFSYCVIYSHMEKKKWTTILSNILFSKYSAVKHFKICRAFLPVEERRPGSMKTQHVAGSRAAISCLAPVSPKPRSISLGWTARNATCFSWCGFGWSSTFIIFGRVCHILLESNYIFQGRLSARAQNDDQQALFNHLLWFQPWLVINVLLKPTARTTLSGYATHLASGRCRLKRRKGKYLYAYTLSAMKTEI